MHNLIQRKATIDDLPSIIALYLEDDLGKACKLRSKGIDQRYIDAFYRIYSDPNQYLMVVSLNDEIIGTCQLTLIPSLTFTGSTRLRKYGLFHCSSLFEKHFFLFCLMVVWDIRTAMSF